ncbi:MAG: agglutinin biogenesis protein MshI [Ideonella sp. MAG2]|nr:MAG: agglutinin biogenesis protein MshI [Ideonella sp. MAG2]
MGWVSVTLQGDTARLVHIVRPAGQKPRVEWVASQPMVQSPALWVQLRKRWQLDKHHVVAVLPRGQYQVVSMEAPDVPRDEWISALRWKLKDVVDFPVDQAAIDVLAIPGANPESPVRSVLAVAAPEERVRPLAEQCQDAHVGLEAIDVVESGLRNLCALTGDAERAQAMVRVGPMDTQLVITYRGELLMVRYIDANSAQVTDPDDDVRQAVFDRIALEAQRTLDMCERLFSYANLGGLWVAPGLGAPGLVEYLRDVVYVPVAEMKLDEVLDISRVLDLSTPEAQSAFSAALGAALRVEPGVH